MKHAILFALSLALAGTVLATSADAAWATHHPRRAEVNARLTHQYDRVMMERRECDLTARQAHLLHGEDRGIRAQERFYASRHDGHISRAEQVRLNHEENAVSRQIGR
jgi:hypothetical protein